MNHKDRRYIIGGVIVLLQYLLFRGFSMETGIPVHMRNISFFIFIFLYFKDDLYSFKTCLVWEELRKQLKCYFEYLIIMGIMVYQLIGTSGLPLYWFLGTTAFIYSLIVSKIIRKVFYNFMKTNLVIVGTGESAKELTNIISKNRFTMYNLVGYLKTDSVYMEENRVDRENILGNYDEMEQLFREQEIDEVIVAIPNLSDSEMNKIIDKIEGKAGRIKFIPKINKMYTFNPQIQDYDGVMLISAKNYMLSRKRKILKRGMDIVGGIVGLGALIPLYIIFGRKIKKDGGPVLFSHNRIGKDLENFKMHKFRSMYIDAEERLEKLLTEDEKLREEFYSNFKLKNDPRITPTGEFLRKTSLDEFPQFLNVLKGEMSLVGPRPVVQKEVDMYYGTEMGKKVFQAKPGITGMWQANGRSDIEDYDERIALDLYYIRNWSIWLDVIILIKTVKNVIGRKGAY